MSQNITLSDEVYRSLVAYANRRHQTPEEAVADWVQALHAQPSVTVAPDLDGRRELEEMAAALAADPSAYRDPWEGFYGAFESPYPDLVERHDYYASPRRRSRC